MRRNQRLRRPEQFGRVRRDGKTWSHPLLSLGATRNRVGRTRCGFVVSKHVGKAHDRNRAKRRTREAVRQVYPRIARGWDLVFIIRPAVIDAPFDALTAAVSDLLRRAGLWTAPEAGQENTDAAPARTRDHSTLPGHLAPDPA